MENTNIMKPNLFSWATSELSQDAFICWLIEWADRKYKGKDDLLRRTAVKLIRELSDSEIKIDDIQVKKQYKNIDILVIINKNKAILIEDKVHTKDSEGQLNRYANLIREEYKKVNASENDIFLIYFKTGDQSNYESIKQKGYKVFKRIDFLKILNEGKEEGIKSEIYLDFCSHLNNIEDSVNSFLKLPIDKWYGYSWIGFYIKLQECLGGEWDYVANPSGGFFGFWWHKKINLDDKKFDFYLQLEQQKLVFKLYVYEADKRRKTRDIYRAILEKKAQEFGIPIKRYGRTAQWMGVAILDKEYRITDENKVLKIDATIENLKQIMSLLDEVEKEVKNTNFDD